MADKNSNDKSVDNIEEQIRKLREEKEELERRNREKQQHEQRLMRENASTRTALISSAGVASGDRRDFSNCRDYGDRSFDSGDSQPRRRSVHQNVHNSSMDGAPTQLNDSVESQRSTGDAEDDDVMSPEHKQALRENRDILVENMTPDDIFNDLISKHILTNADVSRIKERNTTETINEELLNVLIRRSDRAFNVFVASLRRTLQGWLANRLDPGSPQKSKRRRRTGEINVNLNCEKVIPVSRKKQACTCQEVEEQVLIIAKAAFAHIRRKDGSSAAFEQFKKELRQTNEVLKESMEIMHTLKMLCHHGEITDLTRGSVCFTIRCSSLSSCQELWKVYESRVLLQAFQEGLMTPALLQDCNAKEIHLCVKMSRLEYLTCALELAYKEKEALQLKQFRSKPLKRRLKINLDSIEKENTSDVSAKMFCQRKGQPIKEISVNTISTSLSSDQSFIKTCDKFASISGCKYHSKVPGSHQGLEKVAMSDVWCRSYGKDASGFCKPESRQVMSCNSLSDQQVITNQARNMSHKDDKKTQKDGCPYNLRYR